jgi:hypothetical protein
MVHIVHDHLPILFFIQLQSLCLVAHSALDSEVALHEEVLALS